MVTMSNYFVRAGKLYLYFLKFKIMVILSLGTGNCESLNSD